MSFGFAAINDGDPERMGEAFGWSRADIRNAATQVDPQGCTVANVCLGCDAFFAERLGAEISELRRARLVSRV